MIRPSEKWQRICDILNIGIYQLTNITAIILDGKYLQKHQVIIALGITISGEKVALGFVQAGSENGKVVQQLLIDLGSRGLKHDQGMLV